MAHADLTQLERRIAAHFLARPEAIIAETNAEIAKALNLSPMTLTRFFRKLGFKDTADARNQVKKLRYGPKSARIDQRFADSSTQFASQNAEESLALCNAAVSAAFAIRESEVWTRIVDLVLSADAVHVTGFQTMFYMAVGFARRLSYLRDRVQLIDGIDGVYAGLMPSNDARNVLLIIDVFRYGAHAPQLAKLARERGVEVIVVADEFCDWATDITPYVLRYPGETHFFLAMPQGITTGLNLLLQDVIAKLGSDAGQRIKKLSEAQDYFGLFLD
ncbi:MAG: MurR/RpiR family transcriptional regulator [Pseudomonadota bacterium]